MGIVIADRHADKPPPAYAVPAAPTWTGDPITYGEALDSWLAELRQLSDDPAWLEWYRRMHGESAVETPLPPHPKQGDTEGWRQWWKTYNEVFRKAGASAGGLEYDPRPRPRLSKRRRRLLWRRRVAGVVRDLLAAELPEAVAVLTQGGRT
jgi:hypothetical protein